jgi:hypothetical protein
VDPWQLQAILMFEDVGGLNRMSKNKEKVFFKYRPGTAKWACQYAILAWLFLFRNWLGLSIGVAWFGF